MLFWVQFWFSLPISLHTSNLCPEVSGILNLKLLWTSQNSLPGTNTGNINAPSCKSRLRGEEPAGNLAQSASVWAQAEGSICCTQLSAKTCAALRQGQCVGLAGFMGPCYASLVCLGHAIESGQWRWTKSPLWKESKWSAWERVPFKIWKILCQVSDSRSTRLSPGPCRCLHHPSGEFSSMYHWKKLCFPWRWQKDNSSWSPKQLAHETEAGVSEVQVRGKGMK